MKVRKVILSLIVVYFILVLSSCVETYDDYKISDTTETQSGTIVFEEDDESAISTQTEESKTGEYSNAKKAIQTVHTLATLRKEKQESRISFSQKAHENNISVEMLYRYPDEYKDKECFVSGFIVQVLLDSNDPNYIELRIKDSISEEIVYAYYTLEENDIKPLENDYVEIYGLSEGMITYEATSGTSITIPLINVKYFYNNAKFEFESPKLSEIKEQISGIFITENGEEISFPLEQEPYYYSVDLLDEYDECTVVSYTPADGLNTAAWDKYGKPTFYTLYIFEDGGIVVGSYGVTEVFHNAGDISANYSEETYKYYKKQ